MTEPEPLAFRRAEDWRAWLAAHHGEAREAWLLHPRAGHKDGLTYKEALPEALCFGWIDSRLHRCDEGHFLLRYSPRRPRSPWSAQNKLLAEELIKQGRMTEAGLAAIETAKANGRWESAYTDRIPVEPCPELSAALEANATAQANFSSFSQSHRNLCVRWVNDAKTQPARARRIARVVERAARNERESMLY